jgi:hypothetical protein
MPEHSLAVISLSPHHSPLPPPLHHLSDHTSQQPDITTHHSISQQASLYQFHHVTQISNMLTILAIVAISILTLMAEIANADITLKFTTRAEQSAPMPRAIGIGGSRPRRQDLASESDIEARQADSGFASSIPHAPIPLNNQASQGVIYTVDIEIAGVSLPVLVSLTSDMVLVNQSLTVG